MGEEEEVVRSRVGRAAEAALASASLGLNLMRHGGSLPLDSAARLSRMRGLAAKLGQLLSYVDGLVPEESRTAMQSAFAALTDAANASPAPAIRGVVEEEFGSPIDRIFDVWNDEPGASASIGQVHKAVFRGSEVAVKVQHPGIAEAIESDLANATLLQALASRFFGDQIGGSAMMRELADGFRAETDYRQEAASVNRFRAIHAGDSAIVIPPLFPEVCSRRVLTTAWVSGESLSLAAKGDDSSRTRWCETLWRFAFRPLLCHGVFNADPHPGNYFFLPEGRIAFIDFGCCRGVSKARRESIVEMHAAAGRRDENGCRAAAMRMLNLQPGLMAELSFPFVHDFLRPLSESPFRITTRFSGGFIAGAREFTENLRTMDKSQITPQPAELVFLNRLHFGFYSVLAQLDSTVNYAAIEESLSN